MSDLKKSTPWGAIIGAGTGILSMLGQRQRERRALNNQKKLMNLQYNNQRALNMQGHELQMEAWKKTNYPAQMEMLKTAGLNPSLLYGMSGGGGTTTGSQGGGSAASGQAPAPQPMEIGQMLQAGMMKAQIENIKADTKQKLSNTGKTNEETQELKYKNQVAKIFGLEADLYEASNRRDEALSKGQVMHEGKNIPTSLFEKQLIAEVGVILDNAEINNKTKKAQIDDILWKAVNEELENQVKNQNISLSKQQERRLWHQIIQDYIKAGLQGLDTLVKGRLGDIGKKGK